MMLLRFAPSLLLTAALAAQGHVHVVDDGPKDYGSSFLLDLNSDGTLESQLEFGDATAGFTHQLTDFDSFGAAIAALGDLDGNGTVDLAIGAPGDDAAGNSTGTVWILFRALDGSVAARHAIRSGDGPLVLPNGARFGAALAPLGDLDGDGTLELAVGAPQGFPATGGVWILSLESDGSVAAARLLTEGQGGFGGNLDSNDSFGGSLAPLGDLDGDGVADLAVGAPRDDDGSQDSGALWLLYLDTDGSVKSELKLSRTSGGFAGGGPLSQMGSSVCALGDLDSDGVLDLALGAWQDQDGGSDWGAVWILFLNADGTVRAQQKISKTQGGLTNNSHHFFGSAVAAPGDLDGDGVLDLVVGAVGDLGGGLFVLFLNANGTVKGQQRLNSEFTGLASGDDLGSSLAVLGDLDLDGRTDLAAGAARREGAPTGADFTNLQAAVNAAASGDTLLVRSGAYSATDIGAKSLAVQGDGVGAIDVFVTRLAVHDLGAAQTVALSGLRLGGDGTPVAPLELADDDGLVWIEECLSAPGLFQQGPGLRLQNCDKVVLNRSRFEGSSLDGDFGDPTVAPAGLELTLSRVHAYDCTFIGADGRGNFGEPTSSAQDGGAGILSSFGGGFLFLSGCTLQGGDGIYYKPTFSNASCSSGGAGLNCVHLATVLDSTLTGGAGGVNGTVHCGADGAAHLGPLDALGGASLSFSASPLAHEGEDILYTFQGPPFAPVFLMGSPNAGAEFRPTQHGSLLLGTPRSFDFMGTTDGAGTLQVLNPLGLLPPAFDVRRLYLQPLMITPGSPSPNVRAVPSRVTLGAGKLFLVFDESF